MIGTILIVLAGLFAAIIIAGLFISSKYRFSKSILIHADKKKVFNSIDELKEWAIWSAWSKDNDKTIDISYGEKSQGVGAIMNWKGKKMGRGEIAIKKSEPYKEMLAHAVFNKGIFKMDFQFTLEEEKDHTKLTWLVSGKTKRSAFAKILGRIIPKWMGKDIETSLKILKHHCEGNLS